ncbi:tripartite tricarboxylate transporter permease, partial [Salmonella enterica subsp. enterica]|nr:tripartite tricarboxylate transporter permease [Salmonella enterica subsp. enterica]
FVAGTIATILIALFAPPLTEIGLKFGAAERCSLMVVGLVLSVALAHGSPLKAVAMVVLGLLLGLAGNDVISGQPRLNFGLTQLGDQLNFVAIAVGLFGVAEILRNLEDEKTREILTMKVGRLMPTKEDFKRMVGPILRGTGLGSALGILPGNGAVLAAFASYTVEKKLSDRPEEFGHGALAGVAGPESANNAGAQTSFIPMLTLGIPANPVMALMIGAMIIQGIVPGPQVAAEKPELFWGLIASMWIGNFLLIILNLPLIGLWVQLLRVPYYVLFPIIMAFCSIGVYSVNSNVYDLYLVAFSGLLGYVLMKLRCEPAPLLLGFILGPLLEENLRAAMIFSRGDPMTFIYRPLSAGLLLAAVAVLVIVLLPSVRRKRDEVFVEEE